MKLRLRILFLIVGINAGALLTILLIAEFRQQSRDQDIRREARQSFQKWAEWLDFQHQLLEPMVHSLAVPGRYLQDPALNRLVEVPWDEPLPPSPRPTFFTQEGDFLTVWFLYEADAATGPVCIGIPVQAGWLDAVANQLSITPLLTAAGNRESSGSGTAFALQGADGSEVGTVSFLNTPLQPHPFFPDLFPLVSILFLIILLTVSLLSYWGLIRPMGTLDLALRRGDRRPLHRLRGLTGEVSFLARAIDELYDFQDALKSEIALRHAAEEQLRKREVDITSLYQEREKLQRDLHDDIIQHLFALGLAMEHGKHPASAAIRKSLNEVIVRLRAFLEDGGAKPGPETLREAVDSLITAFNRNGGTRIDCAICPGAEPSFSDHVLEIKLILTEAISNAIRHGRPDTIQISFAREEATATLTITDNGNGCNLNKTPIERGLRNMQERASDIGATLSFDSQPGRGFTVSLRKPAKLLHNTS